MSSPGGSTLGSLRSLVTSDSREKKLRPQCGVPTANTEPSRENWMGTFAEHGSHC